MVGVVVLVLVFVLVIVFVLVLASGPKTAAVFLRFLKTFVRKVLCNGLLRYKLNTCPNL